MNLRLHGEDVQRVPHRLKRLGRGRACVRIFRLRGQIESLGRSITSLVDLDWALNQAYPQRPPRFAFRPPHGAVDSSLQVILSGRVPEQLSPAGLEEPNKARQALGSTRQRSK
jgi:hypothetical protein